MLLKKTLSSINNNLEKYLGIRIIPSKGTNLKTNKIHSSISPIYVEFVGAPGVGKSSLYKQLLHKQKNEWLNQKVFTDTISHLKNDELFTYLKEEDRYNEIISIYLKFMDQKFQNTLSKNYDPTDKLRVIKYYYSIISDDIITRIFNKQFSIISDEGLINNFGEVLIEFHLTHKNEIQSILESRAIVYCYAPSDIVADRVLNREKKTGRTVPRHKTDSRESLIKEIDISLQEKEASIALLKQFGVPILSINTAENSTSNIVKIKAFLSLLRTNQ